MSDRPTIDDVASRAGVSTSTVSAVINNKPTVGAETREKVLGIIDDLDYRPYGRKRQLLKRRKQQSIGFVIKEAENPFYAEIARGIRAYANESDYAVYVVSSGGNHHREVGLVALMQSQGVEGLILTPALGDADDLSYLFDLNRAEYPVVMMEQVNGLQTDVISIDNIEMMEKVVTYLIGQGHEKIIHFAGPEYSIHSEERIRGFRGAFSTSQLAFNEGSIVSAGARMKHGYEAAQRYFNRSSVWEATAVTCYNDQVAIGVCRFLQDQGISVPDQVEVFGYDNIELLDYLTVPISSVEAPLRTIGTKAAELLIRRINADAPPPADRATYHGELVIRTGQNDKENLEI